MSLDIVTPKRKRSILGMLPLFKALEEQGTDPESLLSKRGLSLDAMTGAAVIDSSVELEIVSEALEVLNDPILGVKVGSQVSFTSYGTYAMLLMTAETVLDSARVGAEFQNLSLLFSRMTLHFDQEGLEIRYTLPDVPKRLRDFIADRDLMGTFVFMREFLDEAPDILIAGSVRSKPEGPHYDIYKQYINFKVHFDQAYNWFRIPAPILRMKQLHRNSWAHKLYKVQAYEVLRKFYPDEDDVVAQVQQVIQGYQGDYPDVAELAETFGVSERTLRRKLDTANTSYRAIVDEHRRKRALDMLASQGLSVAEVAEQLGYSESASFLRAFKRWTGMTPRQYARQGMA